MGMYSVLIQVTPDQLQEIINDSSLLEEMVDEENDESTIDLDKSWDGLLYLLTGKSIREIEPEFGNDLSKVLFSGQVIDDSQDMGYGPAHYLNSDQVKAVAKELEGITIADISQRFNANEMMAKKVYPEIWNEEDILDYLIEHFEVLKANYLDAAKENNAMISFLS